RRHPRTRASGFDFARPLDRAAARPPHHLLHSGAASLARGRRRGRTCDGGRLRTALLLLHDRRGRAVDPLALEAVEVARRCLAVVVAVLSAAIVAVVWTRAHHHRRAVVAVRVAVVAV